MKPSRRADLGLVLVTAIWGLSFPAVRTAMLAGATPLAFVGVRFGVAAALLLPVTFGELRRSPRRFLGPALGLGVLFGASLALQTAGMTLTTAPKSGFISGTTVIMVPFLDTLVRKARLGGWAVAGSVLALAGLALLADVRDLGTLAQPSRGDLLTLGCAFAYALYLIALQPHLARLPQPPLLAAQFVVVAILALALAPAVEAPRLPPRADVLGALGFCALFTSVATGMIQFHCQARSSPARAAVIFALEPVFAALFAALTIHEQAGPDAVLGGGL